MIVVKCNDDRWRYEDVFSIKVLILMVLPYEGNDPWYCMILLRKRRERIVDDCWYSMTPVLISLLTTGELSNGSSNGSMV